MKYKRLGHAGVKVSEVALGSWLTFGHAVDQDVTEACVRRAFDVGINFIDTADVYARGACETALGRALDGIPRKDYVLATKVFFPMADGPNDQGLSRKHVHESIEASLRRLRTDHVDLYQCHRHDPDVSMREICSTMNDLVRRGMILYWGVSMWPADKIEEAVTTANAHGWEPPVSNQPSYSLLSRSIEEEVLPTSERLGLSQIVYSPLAQGILTGKYRPGEIPPDSRAADDRANHFIKERLTEENFAVVEKLRAAAHEAGVSMPQLALAWCLRHRGVASVIIGATRPEQVEENARASGLAVAEEILAAL